MPDITLDEVLPVAQNLAKRKAHAFIRRSCFPTAEREDIQSQLLLSFLSGWPKFDPGRASAQTFSSRVMDNEIDSILRYKLARRRQYVEYAAPLRDDEPELGNHRESTLSGTPLTLDQQRHFWIDIERALLSLPPVLLETAYALCWYTPSELSLVLGRSRTIIYERIRRLREVLLEAGIGGDYFATGGRGQAPREVRI